MSKYTIVWHPSVRLIEVKPIGFWSLDDFTAYERDLLAIVEQAAGKPFDLMADVTKRGPQSADLVAMYNGLAAKLAASGLRRTVIIGSSPLLGMQIKRVTGVLQPHFVRSADEGRQWLDDQA